MKIAICDDITEYRLSVRSYAEEYFKLRNIECHIDELENGEALLSSDTYYDILFLDIELGDSNGIDIAKAIQKKHKNTVILIVTSYHQYLDEAMDINVTRYIDKPATQKRIFSALDKALSLINENVVILHTKDKQIVRLKLSEIIYAEAKLKSVFVYTKNNSYKIKETMKQLQSMLTAMCFAAPHNSYIVNLNYVRNYKRNELFLTEPYQQVCIAVATRKQAEFKRKFLDFIGEDINND